MVSVEATFSPTLTGENVSVTVGGIRVTVSGVGHAVAAVQAYVSGFRLKQDVQFEQIPPDAPVRIPGVDHPASGLKVTVFLEVEGAAHYLPPYAGNLDIMTSAALRTGERMAQMLVEEVA